MLRQGVTRYNYESVNWQTVAKSVGVYNQKSKVIITCGSHVDDNYKCYSYNGKMSVGFSQKLMPVNSGVVDVIDEIWFIGGRERTLPKDGPLKETASYGANYTNKVIVLSKSHLSNDFRVNETLALPFGIAFHCGLLIRGYNKIFVHGGITNNGTQFLDVLFYDRENMTWDVVKESNPCGSVPLYESTQCELYNKDIIVVPSANTRNQSCTSTFNMNNMKWDKHILNDGRYGIYGGVLINAKSRLLYLGGRRSRLRDSSEDTFRKLSDQESVVSSIFFLWHYGGLDEPSMRKIYEFNGYSWTPWSNELPLPIINNTVVNIYESDYCEVNKPKLMSSKDLELKHSLKPDRTVHLETFSRCTKHETETGVFWYDGKMSVIDNPLKSLKCVTAGRMRNNTFYKAKSFCYNVCTSIHLHNCASADINVIY